MPHADNCSRSTENRQNARDINTSAYNEAGRRIYIAEALQAPGGRYYCLDDACRAEMVPRKAAHNIPLRRETDEGVEEGFYDRRAHFAALADRYVRGPGRQKTSQHQEAIELIASHLRASGLYATNEEGEPAVYLDSMVNVELDRREPTIEHPKGWGPLAEYDADIVATRYVNGKEVDFIIQVEENPISSRYGSSNSLIERVRRLADSKSDKRKNLFVAGEFRKEMSKKVYQGTVVLRNGYYFREGGEDLRPVETVLLTRLFDNLLVLDMEQEALLIPGEEEIEALTEFGFIETLYEGKDRKRFEEPVLNREGKTVKIPELRIARAVPIVYNQDSGMPVNQDSSDQAFLF